ncbi:cytoplasmic dynein 2 light intermediate chain 1-like [Convolutriloba macropyga]|uniref:cytoplasmic dynein 2 light intermediate chain 1-like n=1 Tax=Convolutriloba macropyga TaxID=536237 RepID=UPI003F528729
MSETVWSLATKEVESQNEKRKDEKLLGEERTVLFVGPKQSGKTSLLLKFLEKNEERAKPSVALEYTFARRPKSFSLEKDIVHLWELAGGTFLSDLTDAIITPESLTGFSVVLALDLSQPQLVWVTLEHFLIELKKKIERLMNSDPDTKRTMEKSINDRRMGFAKGFDASSMFPVPLLIVGTKFDLFVNMESVEKKMIGRALRFVAHTYAAHVLFVSEKVPATLRYFKVFMNNLAFGAPMQKVIAIDESKPIAISAGNDDLMAISMPTTSDSNAMNRGDGFHVHSWDEWKKGFCDFFPQKAQETDQNSEDPAKDAKYKEQLIDDLKKQKFAEIENLRRKQAKRDAGNVAR